jgi:hypothetical protein
MLTRRGGDANGLRIYTLYAIDEPSCLAWMNAICEAVGPLELKYIGEGIYQSAVNADAMKQRDKSRVQAAFFKPGAVQNVKKAAGVMEKEEKVEEILTEEENNLRSLVAMDRRANNGNTVIMAGRGGRGNSVRIHGGVTRDSFSKPSLTDPPTSPLRQSAAGRLSFTTDSNSPKPADTSETSSPSFSAKRNDAIPRSSMTPFMGAGRGNRSALSALTPQNSSKSAPPNDN